MLSLIVAVADDGAIGRKNALPWHLKADLRHFKAVTSGHKIIMGQNTFESLGCVLPHREHYVLSDDPSFEVEHQRVHVCRDLDALMKEAQDSDEEWFIIGGATIYRLTFSRVNRFYLTRVHTEVEDADAFFPPIDFDEWNECRRSGNIMDESSGITFEFIDYERKK